jgi:hypothetical protein
MSKVLPWRGEIKDNMIMNPYLGNDFSPPVSHFMPKKYFSFYFTENMLAKRVSNFIEFYVEENAELSEKEYHLLKKN